MFLIAIRLRSSSGRIVFPEIVERTECNSIRAGYRSPYRVFCYRCAADDINGRNSRIVRNRSPLLACIAACCCCCCDGFAFKLSPLLMRFRFCGFSGFDGANITTDGGDEVATDRDVFCSQEADSSLLA